MADQANHDQDRAVDAAAAGPVDPPVEKAGHIALRQVALSRAGDKGEISNVSVIPYDPADFDWIRSEVTVPRVAAIYGALVSGPIERYELPGIRALNFVMHGALQGGVSRSLAMDVHGKSRGALMGTLQISLQNRVRPSAAAKERGTEAVTTQNNLVTVAVDGGDGIVRGMFQNRQRGATAAGEKFPGVPAVAIMPRAAASEEDARAFIAENAEPGGNAVAVRFAKERWLVGAYVAS